MADDLKDQIAAEISDKFGGFPGGLVADVVLSVVEPRLERLRKELTDAREESGELATELANERTEHQATIRRAEQAEAKLARHIAAVWTVPGEEPETVIAERDALKEALAYFRTWHERTCNVAQASRQLLATGVTCEICERYRALDHPTETPTTT